jgi:hypothetical protein
VFSSVKEDTDVTWTPDVAVGFTDADADAKRALTWTLESTPREACHGSTRALARACGLSQSALTEKQIRCGIHCSTRELEAAIVDYIRVHNKRLNPFAWIHDTRANRR